MTLVNILDVSMSAHWTVMNDQESDMTLVLKTRLPRFISLTKHWGYWQIGIDIGMVVM